MIVASYSVSMHASRDLNALRKSTCFIFATMWSSCTTCREGNWGTWKLSFGCFAVVTQTNRSLAISAQVHGFCFSYTFDGRDFGDLIRESKWLLQHLLEERVFPVPKANFFSNFWKEIPLESHCCWWLAGGRGVEPLWSWAELKGCLLPVHPGAHSFFHISSSGRPPAVCIGQSTWPGLVSSGSSHITLWRQLCCFKNQLLRGRSDLLGGSWDYQIF